MLCPLVTKFKPPCGYLQRDRMLVLCRASCWFGCPFSGGWIAGCTFSVSAGWPPPGPPSLQIQYLLAETGRHGKCPGNSAQESHTEVRLINQAEPDCASCSKGTGAGHQPQGAGPFRPTGSEADRASHDIDGSPLWPRQRPAASGAHAATVFSRRGHSGDN